jgi:hypothetical protein
LQQYLPNGVIKVASGRDSVAKLVCQNDEFASSLENTPSVKFLGQIIDSSGYRVDPDKVKAIVEMKMPDDISGIRRFFGMVNQLNKFSPKITELTKPLRE